MKNSAIRAMFAQQHNVDVQQVKVEFIMNVNDEYHYSVLVQKDSGNEVFDFACRFESVKYNSYVDNGVV